MLLQLVVNVAPALMADAHTLAGQDALASVPLPLPLGQLNPDHLALHHLQQTWAGHMMLTRSLMSTA